MPIKNHGEPPSLTFCALSFMSMMLMSMSNFARASSSACACAYVYAFVPSKNLSWVPKVLSRHAFVRCRGSRKPTDRPEAGNERQSRERTSGKERLDLPCWMDLDPSNPIKIKFPVIT